MDEALRRLERGDDPVAYAARLRRAGDEVQARRTVEAAAGAGHTGARAALDAWWPLDPRVERVVSAALGDPNHWRWSNVRAALAWLLADEDPRVEAAIARLAADLLDETGIPVDSAGWHDDERLIAAARGDAAARRRVAIEQAGDGLPLSCLSRARLDAGEVRQLLARAQRPGDDHQRLWRRLLLASAVWYAGQVGLVDVLREHLDARAPFVAAEAATWLAAHEPGSTRAPLPALLGGRAHRPAWSPSGCPAEHRDVLTGAILREFFVGDPAAPLVSDAPREAPMTDWLLDVDVVNLRRIADLHGIPPGDQVLVDVTACLQRCVGDRVARWGGDEWLVRLEPDVDARGVAEALRAAVAALEVPVEGGDPLRVTVSIGVGRADTWAQAIIRASTAMALAAQEGGDRVREAS